MSTGLSEKREAAPPRPRVVIVGGGFGGLYAARSLRGAAVDVTLIDRRNFYLFQPLLYQVATGGLSPANISAPIRALLRRQKNARVMMAEVVGFDASRRVVKLARPAGEVPYDYLIVAAGVGANYFGHDDWAEAAPGLKTVEDATEIRSRILAAFEAAEVEHDPQRVRELLTFVIIGGGPTGLELAGTLAEIARRTLRGDFRRINPSDAKIILLEGTDRLLPPYPPVLSAKATELVERLGVTVRTGTMVTDIRPGSVELRRGEAVERIAARTVIWAAGVSASPLGRAIAEATGAKLDRAGRVMVEPDTSVAGHPNIFVIGDLAHFAHGTPDGKPLPGVAQVAMQQGKYVARLIRGRVERRERLAGTEARSTGSTEEWGGPPCPPNQQWGGPPRPPSRQWPPFRYRDLGNMATIGRAAAVADIFGVKLSGYPAWLVWLFIHLINLVQHQNKLLVLIQWAWNYFTWNRSARLITGEQRRRLLENGGVDERHGGESGGCSTSKNSPQL